LTRLAASADAAGLVVLHDDKDFDLIAGVTGQPVQRVDVSMAPG
jgi:predicted nucleic acid-binding protein